MKKTDNNIGFLRLVLALCVIIGHAPEMVDGDRSRDPLTLLLHGPVSLGLLSVYGFFLLSGYLITASIQRSSSFDDYLKRRVLRIYPAYLIAYALSLYLLGSVAGAHPASLGVGPVIGAIFLLPPPVLDSQLSTLPYRELNGAMWTIAYEFRCYLLLAILSRVGILKHRRLAAILASVAVLLVAFSKHKAMTAVLASMKTLPLVVLWMGVPSYALSFSAAFIVGACFCLFEAEIMRFLSGKTSVLFALAAGWSMYRGEHVAEAGLIVFGAPALFWLALKAPLGPLRTINNDWDISYGVYLYGWPIATFILWKFQPHSPWTLALLTLPFAIICGAISWFTVERHALRKARSQTRFPASASPSVGGIPDDLDALLGKR